MNKINYIIMPIQDHTNEFSFPYMGNIKIRKRKNRLYIYNIETNDLIVAYEFNKELVAAKLISPTETSGGRLKLSFKIIAE